MLILVKFEPLFGFPAALLGVPFPSVPQLAAMGPVSALDGPQFCSCSSGTLLAPTQDHMSQQAWSSHERMSALEVRVVWTSCLTV